VANPFESLKVIGDCAETVSERVQQLRDGEGDISEMTVEIRELIEIMESHLDVVRDVAQLDVGPK
jgi:hypothetical protein